MSFFNNFPYTAYDLNNDGLQRLIHNIFRFVDVNDINIDDITEHNYHIIADGDRPDNVSKSLYGSPDYYWTFFIVNDFLKDGMKAWPKSDKVFRDWVADEYGQYTVHQYNPIYNESTNITIGETTYLTLLDIDDYWGDIDFHNDNVYLLSDTGVKAKILSYDFNTLQLWCYDHDGDKDLFNSGTSYQLVYEGTEGKNEWLLSMIDFFSKTKQSAYYNFTNDIGTAEILPYSQPYYDLFETTYLTGLAFAGLGKFYPAYDAPKSYDVSHFDALETGYTEAISYMDYEQARNFKSSQIRVISPSFIMDFAELFKETINNG